MINHSKIAKRYIAGGKGSFSSFLSISTIIGMAIGVWSLILITSVMNGFEKQLLAQTLMVSNHLEVYSEDKNLIKKINVEGITNKVILKKNSSVIKFKDQIKGVRVLGSTIELLEKYNLYDGVGLVNSIDNKRRSISIGDKLSEHMGVTLGSKIDIIYSKDGETKTKVFKVGYIYDSGVSFFDNNIVIINIKESESIWGENDYTYAISVNDPAKVELTKAKIKEIIKKDPNSCEECILDWKDTNTHLMTALKTEKTAMVAILSILLFVSMFNLISSLLMTVKDKIKEIGVMRTLGAKKSDIKKIFLMKGVMIGFIGSTLGLILGLISAFYITEISTLIEAIIGFNLLDPEVFRISVIISDIQALEVSIIYVGSIIVTILSSLIPALKAGNIQIVDALDK